MFVKSAIAEALSLSYSPLAIFYVQEPPLKGKGANGTCAMIPIAQAAKGETIFFSATSCSCPGASWGFGWIELTPNVFPGGKACFEHFLSIGNAHWKHGQQVIEQMKEGGAPKIFVQEFSEGEGFMKTLELAAEFADSMPKIKPEGPYVVIKPLDKLFPEEKPQLVSFLVNADQLSALTILANFSRHGNDNVRIPFGAGCMTFILYPFYESKQEVPRAVIGLTDVSARMYMRKLLGKEFLSFTVPWAFFEEMEANVPESFLTRFTWKTMMGKKSSE